MDKKDTNGEKEWTVYKTATLLASVAFVVVVVCQGILDHYYTERWKHIEYLDKELASKRAELAKQEVTPSLEVRVNTLERAGVSSQLLSGMKAFPSTVEIKNVGGGTAHGLVLDLNSSEPITQFQKWPAMEPITITRDMANGKSLRIDASQLRKGASVGVTVLTTKPPKITCQGTTDVGELTILTERDERKYREPSYFRLYSQFPDDLSFDKREALAKQLEGETNPLKIRIAILQRQVRPCEIKRCGSFYHQVRRWWSRTQC